MEPVQNTVHEPTPEPLTTGAPAARSNGSGLNSVPNPVLNTAVAQEPDLRLVERTRLNIAMRVFLMLIVVGAVFFLLRAARPPEIFHGPYPAAIGRPQAVYSLWQEPVLNIMVVHPAVVTFPPEANLNDYFCMGVLWFRGTAPATRDYDEWTPQERWDEYSTDGILLYYDILFGKAPDGSELKLDNGPMMDWIGTNASYRISWFANDKIVLYPNKSAGTLLCYRFFYYTNNQDVWHIPFGHQIEFIIRHTELTAWPIYYFRYNSERFGWLPEQAIELKRENIYSFLDHLADEAPWAVTRMTKSQRDQIATEVPWKEQ